MTISDYASSSAGGAFQSPLIGASVMTKTIFNGFSSGTTFQSPLIGASVMTTGRSGGITRWVTVSIPSDRGFCNDTMADLSPLGFIPEFQSPLIGASVMTLYLKFFRLFYLTLFQSPLIGASVMTFNSCNNPSQELLSFNPL